MSCVVLEDGIENSMCVGRDGMVSSEIGDRNSRCVVCVYACMPTKERAESVEEERFMCSGGSLQYRM